MDFLHAIQANLLSPPILFFALGVIAALVKCDLKFPETLYVTLTIYLLVAIGFKGGAAIAEAGMAKVWLPALAAVLLGALIPLWCYPLLKKVFGFNAADAAAIAAHYGSVSAVTFIAASNYLKSLGEPPEAYASAFLAVMESPAILIGVLLGKRFGTPGVSSVPMREILHEALFGRSIFLLLGALAAGFLAGKPGLEATAGFFVTPFQGVLTLFLLELGTVAGRRLADIRQSGPRLLIFGTIMPVIHGFIGTGIGAACGLSIGGTALMGTLAASASYIAAPAAMRLSLPEANPSLYLTASLAITFPFNITLGLPLYLGFARWWISL